MVYIELTRFIISFSNAHQAYKTYYFYFEKLPRSYKSPYQMELMQGYSITKKSFL